LKIATSWDQARPAEPARRATAKSPKATAVRPRREAIFEARGEILEGPKHVKSPTRARAHIAVKRFPDARVLATLWSLSNAVQLGARTSFGHLAWPWRSVEVCERGH
jgi:hypothetical protein